MDKYLYFVKNRATGKLIDTVVADKVRDDGKFYDFFEGDKHIKKINKLNYYYEQYTSMEKTPEEIAEEEERENARFLDPEEDFKIYYDEFQ